MFFLISQKINTKDKLKESQPFFFYRESGIIYNIFFPTYNGKKRMTKKNIFRIIVLKLIVLINRAKSWDEKVIIIIIIFYNQANNSLF